MLDALLEGFAAPAQGDPAEWKGRFATGDRVRVTMKGGKSIVGRVLRPHGAKASTHVVIDPEGGGAHVEAEVASVRLDTPTQHATEAKRAQDEAMKQAQQVPGSGIQGSKNSGIQGPAKGPPVREGITMLMEAFAPPVTPAQGAVIGAKQVATAKSALAAYQAWNAQKHPRGAGGKFGYTTGGKRAKRSSTSTQRVLNQGSSGTLVSSIQRQLGVPVTGTYNPQTQQAVTNYQRQHGLTVDGVVGRQTLAALRGNTNARSIAPGPIASKSARVGATKAAAKPFVRATPKPTQAQLAARPVGTPGTRMGGGVVV